MNFDLRDEFIKDKNHQKGQPKRQKILEEKIVQNANYLWINESRENRALMEQLLEGNPEGRN